MRLSIPTPRRCASALQRIKPSRVPALPMPALALACLALLLSTHPGLAQWITQTNTLKAGWNAVYLHVDPSHTDINSLVQPTDPIEEIWLWNSDLPPSQALALPPLPAGSQWSTWTRNDGPASALQTLRGNAALLVRVEDTVTPSFLWKVKGRPVGPSYRWTLSGLNFVGFPTARPFPNFENFLSRDAQEFDWGMEATNNIFRYVGGNLSTNNPVLVAPPFLRNHLVNRDQAFWVRAGEATNQFYNQYFGPFQVKGGTSGSSGGGAFLRFGDAQGQARLYLKNMSKTTNLTVTLRLVDSETTPQGATVPKIPLLVRGPINTTNLTHTYSNLTTGTYQWTLTKKGDIGSEAEIILGLNRSEMGSTAGTEYGGVLRFTDSHEYTQVDIGVSAVTPSRAGLWVGTAWADAVSQYLRTYAKATNAAHFHSVLNRLQLTTGVSNPTSNNALGFALNEDKTLRYDWHTNTGRITVIGTNTVTGKKLTGAYILDSPEILDTNLVERPFPLRLIVHNDGTTPRLMQRAYLGLNASSNLVVATRQDILLATQLASARRVSSVHLPTTDTNNPWDFSGNMEPGNTMSATITLLHNDHSSNPFLHTYHPDHDNYDAQFKTKELVGRESYQVKRVISLQFIQAEDHFDSLTQSGANLTGYYFETLTFQGRNNAEREFHVVGHFNLARVTDTATLATNVNP